MAERSLSFPGSLSMSFPCEEMENLHISALKKAPRLACSSSSSPLSSPHVCSWLGSRSSRDRLSGSGYCLFSNSSPFLHSRMLSMVGAHGEKSPAELPFVVVVSRGLQGLRGGLGKLGTSSPSPPPSAV